MHARGLATSLGVDGRRSYVACAGRHRLHVLLTRGVASRADMQCEYAEVRVCGYAVCVPLSLDGLLVVGSFDFLRAGC